jgi:hypothetical protein
MHARKSQLLPAILFAALPLCLASCLTEPPKGETAPSAPPPTAARGQDERILIETDCLAAEVWPNGYVSGVKAGTFLDKKSGARDHSFGLDIVDFLMGPGAAGGLAYEFGNSYHGNIAKHYIEQPQICTQAKHIDSELLVGRDFVAVRQGWQYTQAAPGYTPGSKWSQTLVFPAGRRYFLASDRIESANDVPNVFLRLDMPAHIKHTRGDTFEEVYLSYEGRIPASDFFTDFPPDARHLYQRGKSPLPQRMIRARKIRGEGMPWLAGMTLDPAVVSEAWCHQRGYVCFIQEIGGLAVRRGDFFSAAYAVGYFDDIGRMEAEFDRLRGFTSLAATKEYWLLAEGVIVEESPGRYRIVPQGSQAAKKSWRVLAHGRGEAVINGKAIRVEGERVFDVPK